MQFLDIPPAGKRIIDMTEVELKAYEQLLDIRDAMLATPAIQRDVQETWTSWR